MAVPGPRRQHQQDLRSGVARHDVSLVRIKRDHRAHARVERLARGLDLRRAVHDDEERMLLDLVIAELLPGQQPDQDGSALVGGMQDDGRSASVRGLDLWQSPAAHKAILTGFRAGLEARLDSPS